MKTAICNLEQYFQATEKVMEICSAELDRQVFPAMAGAPFKIPDAGKDWQAMKTFALDHLVELLPDAEASVGSVQGQQDVLMTLKEYARLIQKGVSTKLYFKSQFHLHTNLRFDYSPPDAFACWYAQFPGKSKRFALSWVYVGGKGTMSGLHTDVWNTSAWNVVITGKKLWVFFPPDQEKYLYGGRVNPFEPELTLYPDFSQANPVVAIQNPGDLIYTPSRWWHAVYNLESGVSLTENFMNQTNVEHVREYFKKHRQSKALESIDFICNYYNH